MVQLYIEGEARVVRERERDGNAKRTLIRETRQPLVSGLHFQVRPVSVKR